MNDKIKILIVEDEAIIAESIKITIENLGYEVIGVVSNALDAIDIIKSKIIDLAILDINIQGDKNGIWLAETMFKNKAFIYLTAYGDDKTIQQAMETKPSNYLLKPFKKEDISIAIKVALANYTNNEKASISINKKINNEDSNNFLAKEETIFVKQKGVYKKLVINNILFFEADKNYIKIQTENSNYIIRATLKEVSKNLNNNFIQVHRSFVVNINHVNAIYPISIKVGSFTIPISTSFKKDLFKKVDILNK